MSVKTVWNAVYENRFPKKFDGSGALDAFRAADGQQEIQDGPVSTSFTGLPGFGIAAGRSVAYSLDNTLRDVIGVDAVLDFVFRFLPVGQMVSLFNIDNNLINISLLSESTTQQETICRLLLRVGDKSVEVSNLPFSFSSFPLKFANRRLRVRWYTNGQLQVWLDEDLIAYQNNAAPGRSFSLASFHVGEPQGQLTGIINVSVTGIRILELQDKNSTDVLGEQLDLCQSTYIPDECGKVAIDLHEKVMSETRTLMSKFVQSKTIPWRKEDGGSPFSNDSIIAHESAQSAAKAFADHLRSNNTESAEQMVSELKVFLNIIALDQPDLFESLVGESRIARKQLIKHCPKLLSSMRSDPSFVRLEKILAPVDELLEQIGGTQNG